MSEQGLAPVVLAAVDDIFFSTKIEAAAKGSGVKLVQVLNDQKLQEQLASLVPNLVILDLDSRSCSPLEAIRRIKADPKYDRTPVVGFFSHVHVELEQAAREAGCDRVMPRSTFVAKLPEILEIARSDCQVAD